MEQQKILFLKRLAYLLEASVPLAEAFQISRVRVTHKTFAKALSGAQASVSSGNSLHESFRSELLRKIFDTTTAMSIQMGESTGTLVEALRSIVTQLEQQKKFKQEITSALLYPCIVSVFACLLILLLLGYIYPQILPVFSSFKAELPFSTRVVMALSIFIKEYWLWSLGVVTVVSVSTYFGLQEFRSKYEDKYERSRKFIERFVLKLPFLGETLTFFELSRAARILTVACNGPEYIEAFKSAVVAVRLLVFKDIFQAAAISVENGRSLSAFLSENKQFPSLWTDMLLVGEKTGRLSESYKHIADIHEEDVRERMAIASKLIEPLLMICTGLIVAFIALSIITPLYGLTSTLQGGK